MSQNKEQIILKFIQKIAGYLLCWLSETFNSEYLWECTDHFWQNHDIGWHWKNIRLPMVRRIFVDQVGVNLVKTEPLSKPSGLLFTLVYKPSQTPK